MAKRIGANERLKLQQKKLKANTAKKRAMKKGWKFILLIMIGLSLSYGGYRAYNYASTNIENSKILKINKVVVNGNVTVDSHKILKIAGLELLDSSSNVKSTNIKKRLLNSGYFKSVKVNRKYPSTLKIKVIERSAIAFVNLGKILLVDSDGYLWPLNTKSYWALPLLSGLKDTLVAGKNILNKKSIIKLKGFFKELNKTAKIRLDAISQVEFSEYGIVKIHLESSSIIALLNKNEINEDLVRLWKIMSNIKMRGEAEPAIVDLSCGELAFVQ